MHAATDSREVELAPYYFLLSSSLMADAAFCFGFDDLFTLWNRDASKEATRGALLAFADDVYSLLPLTRRLTFSSPALRPATMSITAAIQVVGIQADADARQLRADGWEVSTPRLVVAADSSVMSTPMHRTGVQIGAIAPDGRSTAFRWGEVARCPDSTGVEAIPVMLMHALGLR